MTRATFRDRTWDARRVPGYPRLASAGEMGVLAINVVRSAIKPPYSWRRDLAIEISIGLRRCVPPAFISIVAFAFGQLIYYIASIVLVLGTLDRLGGAMITAFIREIGVWVSLMIVAGVAGSAMTADLGARKIRDELDALKVLGVDTLKSLVVPRVLAMMVVGPIIGFMCVAVATFMGVFVAPVIHGSYLTTAGFLETARAFTTVGEVVNMFVKLVVAGAVVGIVSCVKGLNAEGGAEGVGRAVNSAVLICFFALWTINVVANILFSTLFPSIHILRG
jgi:phospholipid/cholesterol/gamma-HCH transport system permease protein